MKTYKTLVLQLDEAAASKKTKTKVVGRVVGGLAGAGGSFLGGAAAAAHRAIIQPAHTKYGYQPIADYMRSMKRGTTKRKVYIETDD